MSPGHASASPRHERQHPGTGNTHPEQAAQGIHGSRSATAKRLGATLSSVVLGAVTACGATGADDATSGSSSTVAGTVTVFAAASLTDVAEAIADELTLIHPDLELRFNFAGSSTLREQILQGAPADVFASASVAIMESLTDDGLVEGEAVTFARNGLFIAVPRGNPALVSGLSDFSRDELLIGLCARRVPCGELAHQALDAAGIEESLDTEEPDVRALVTKIAADELDAGIVYASDVVAAGDDIEAIPLPRDIAPTATYPIAVLTSSDDPDAARVLVDFVLSPPGQTLLREYGFEAP